MHDLTGRRIAILATHGFEQSELEVPLHALREAGAQVDVVSPASGEIRGWDKKDWGRSVPVDRALEGASEEGYDALVLPGGQMNPDILRANKQAVDLVRSFSAAGKPIAAICHAPWLLIETDMVSGLRATSYHTIRKDMINAGADWVDEPAVIDRNIVTSRKPADLDAFCTSLIELINRSSARSSPGAADLRA